MIFIQILNVLLVFVSKIAISLLRNILLAIQIPQNHSTLKINNQQQMKQQTKTKHQISTFLIKLLRILEDSECQDLVGWIETYSGFKITNVHEFTEKVLPKYFKHQNFSSFVRQLNLYGFTKVRGLEYENVYHHPNFKRGSKASLKKIERKVPNLSEEQPHKTRTHQKKREDRYETQKNLEEIKQQQVTLQQRFKQTLSYNMKVFQNNSKVIHSLNKKDHREQEFIQSLFTIFKINKKQQSLSTASQLSRTHKNSEEQSKNKQESMFQPENKSNKDEDYVEIQEFQQFSDFEEINMSENS